MRNLVRNGKIFALKMVNLLLLSPTNKSAYRIIVVLQTILKKI